jgi:hypothetical protein
MNVYIFHFLLIQFIECRPIYYHIISEATVDSGSYLQKGLCWSAAWQTQCVCDISLHIASQFY